MRRSSIRRLTLLLWAAGAMLPTTWQSAQAETLRLPLPARTSLLEPVAVFGSDDRTNVPPRLHSVADRIGLLFNNQARTVCTAFCVGANIIATAAHCVTKGQTSASFRYSDFSFARNYDRTREFTKIEGHQTGSAAQHIATGDFRLRVRPPIDAAHDWALIRLQKPVCPAGGLKVRTLHADELMAESRAGRVYQVAYHRDWAQWRPAYSKPCSISRDFEAARWPAIAADFLDAEQMLLHTCDTGGASSGSPILLDSPEGPVVVGINVGTYVQARAQTRDGQVTLRQKSETVANTAVNAHAFASRIQLLREAPILGSGDPIRDLQQRLMQLNFYAGRIDGAYGPSVRSAIEAYERASELPVTGLATRTLLTRLAGQVGRSGEVVPSSGVANAGTNAPEPRREQNRRRTAPLSRP